VDVYIHIFLPRLQLDVSDQLHAPLALLPGTEPSVSIGQEASNPRTSRGNMLGHELCPSVTQYVAIPTELSRPPKAAQMSSKIDTLNVTYSEFLNT
jgi:hypothetical protein